jgi:hypothetical protein
VEMTDEFRPCPSCSSFRNMKCRGEICLHFPGGLQALKKFPVFVFPHIVVCLDCGSAKFTVPESELMLIRQHL